MTYSLLATGKLQRPFVALRVPFQANANRRHPWAFHHETISHGNSRRHGRNLCVAANDRDQVGLGLSWWIRQDLADEAVQAQPDICHGFLCGLYVGKPAEAKVCV